MSSLISPTSWSDAKMARDADVLTSIRGTVVDLDPSLKPYSLPDEWTKERAYSMNGSKVWLPSFAVKARMLDAVTDTSRAALNKATLAHEAVPGNIYHSNYLTYLEQCYANHWTPVFSPDLLWFTCLNEIATIVRDNAEALRELFTFASPGAPKTEIIVQSGDPIVLPVRRVVAHLREFVPTGIDQFLPQFTTSTEASQLAFAAAFCDVVSPYYEYGMFMCGFPRIVITGTCDDYIRVVESWRNLPPKLAAAAGTYFASTLRILEDIVVAFEGATRETEKAQRFWRDIFTAERCGSGHQTEIDGWFTRLFRKGAGDAPRYASNFEPHVAKVDYKQLDFGKTYTMLQGVFSSQLGPNAVAVPQFGSLVFDTTAKA